MGLIRKSLSAGSLGIVRGSSKKQRVAKAQLDELRDQTRLMQEADTTEHDPSPLDSPVPAVREAERRRIDAQNKAMNLRPTEREQTVKVLWGLFKDGALSREQFDAAYEALGPVHHPAPGSER